MLSDDFQHLLKKNQKEDLLVVPRKSLQLGATSLIFICFGLGFTAACLYFGHAKGNWTFGVCIAIALFLGRKGNKIEDHFSEKYREEKTR